MPIIQTRLKIAFLELRPDLPGANELVTIICVSLLSLVYLCIACWCICYAYIHQIHWYSKQVWTYANRWRGHYLPSLEHQVPNHNKSNGKSHTRKVLASTCIDLPCKSWMKSLCPGNGHSSWGLINTTHISHHNKPMASLHVIKSHTVCHKPQRDYKSKFKVLILQNVHKYVTLRRAIYWPLFTSASPQSNSRGHTGASICYTACN